MMVDSSATTGRPSATAAATSGDILRGAFTWGNATARYRQSVYRVAVSDSAGRRVPVTLRSGESAILRPIGPGDAIRLVQFHERLSDRTVYFRFFAAHPHLTPVEIERFTHVDHVTREAYVAVLDDRIIGVGRWDATGDRLAEVAFVISDEFQSQGLGSVLFSLLAEQAKAHGIEGFYAEMLPQNRGMRRLFEVFGTVTERTVEDGIMHIKVTLDDFA